MTANWLPGIKIEMGGDEEIRREREKKRERECEGRGMEVRNKWNWNWLLCFSDDEWGKKSSETAKRQKNEGGKRWRDFFFLYAIVCV